MSTQEQIDHFIAAQPEQKRGDVEQLHQLILEALPGCKLWFDTGINSEGKTVTNPTIGYGTYINTLANGTGQEIFRIGLSTNKTGISVYILGIKDKTYLAQTYGANIGKATVSGYCIKFNKFKDINIPVLMAAIEYGAALQA